MFQVGDVVIISGIVKVEPHKSKFGWWMQMTNNVGSEGVITTVFSEYNSYQVALGDGLDYIYPAESLNLVKASNPIPESPPASAEKSLVDERRAWKKKYHMNF